MMLFDLGQRHIAVAMGTRRKGIEERRGVWKANGIADNAEIGSRIFERRFRWDGQDRLGK